MPDYATRASKLLTDVEQEAIVQMIARDPTCGAVLQGTGGVRKLRFGAGGPGKRGGVRILYYFHSDVMPAYLLTIFAKNEKANLPRKDLNALADLVAILKRSHGR